MLNSSLTFLNVKMLTIFNGLSTDQGLIVLLQAVPNLESLVFAMYMHDEVKEDSDGDDENDSDEDAEGDSDEDAEGDSDEDDGDNNEGDGGDDNDANSVQGGNNQDNVDEVDVADPVVCINNDDDYDSTDDSWAPGIVTTGCLFPHLKSVCFQGFAGNPREMRWVKMILRKAKALQIMTISYTHDIYGCYLKQRSEKEVMVEIPCFRRASPDCVIEFCSWD
ncbi:hypothetical protein MKW92_032883 [Papaver armeniacum]|nr:hypothetical protein MKW92_032883 [Papaver armeniacum]